MIGEDARKCHLGCLSHKMLGQMIAQDPFKPGLFYDSMTLKSNHQGKKREHTQNIVNTANNQPVVVLK